MSNDKQLLTKKEIARRYGVSTRTVSGWMKRRVLPFTKPSARMVRFEVEICDLAIATYEHRSIFHGAITQELERRLADRKRPILFTSEFRTPSE